MERTNSRWIHPLYKQVEHNGRMMESRFHKQAAVDFENAGIGYLEKPGLWDIRKKDYVPDFLINPGTADEQYLIISKWYVPERIPADHFDFAYSVKADVIWKDVWGYGNRCNRWFHTGWLLPGLQPVKLEGRVYRVTDNRQSAWVDLNKGFKGPKEFKETDELPPYLWVHRKPQPIKYEFLDD